MPFKCLNAPTPRTFHRDINDRRTGMGRGLYMEGLIFGIFTVPREIVLFLKKLENAVPFTTGSYRKFKPDFLVEWKTPIVSELSY